MDKPKILFLHGSGTNADIFRLQSRKLAALLQPHFTLTYLDAPLTCAAGPGVLPFFDGCGPYRTWLDDSSPAAEQAYWDGQSGLTTQGTQNGGKEAATLGEGIAAVVDEVKRLGGVVGVVGFSMGAKVGMEVVRRLEAEAEGEGGRSGVRIVVAVCGTVPFRGGASKGEDGEADPAREAGYRAALAKGVVRAESVHLIGERDPWRAESEKLVEFFDEKARRVVRFRGEHHMPLDDAVNKQMARIILAAAGGQ